MTDLTFCYFMDYEDGKMARVETTGEYEIPVNIFIDNADEFGELAACPCSINICGVGSGLDLYATEEEFRSAGTAMEPISMIPMGTFSPTNSEDFEESPHILFVGKVLGVDWNPMAGPNEPNCCMRIQTLEMEFDMYTRCSAVVKPGYIVHGVAWLYGDLELKNS